MDIMYKIQCKYIISGIKFLYAINHAAKNGHVEVLDWWLKKSGYKFRYNELAIILATENNHSRVLEWFKNEETNILEF